MSVRPTWFEIRRGVTQLIPFPYPGESLPGLPLHALLGRVVWSVDGSTEAVRTTSRANTWLCSDATYDLGSLHAKSRNQLRKALREEGAVHPSTWGHFWAGANVAIADTFARQQRQGVPRFVSYLRVLEHVDVTIWEKRVEIWVAQRHGVTGSIALGLKYRDTYHILHSFSFTEHLAWCPNNLLIFHLTSRAFRELGCRSVNFGVDGLDSDRLAGLGHFKRRMGFELVPCREEYIAKPGVLTCIGLASRAVTMLMGCLPSLAGRSVFRVLMNLEGRIRANSTRRAQPRSLPTGTHPRDH